MFKSIITMAALAAALIGSSAWAADVNKADQAELESIKGVGPALSTRILDERKKASFKDWDDLLTRVKGLGPGNAGRFSEAGLTVAGQTYPGAAPTPKSSKTPSKADAKAPAPKS